MNIAKNEDWAVGFTYGWTDPDTEEFTPINLTGSVLRWQIRRREEDHEVLVFVNSPDNGITITNAAAGEFTVVIPRDKLVRLSPGDYASDLVREMPSGLIERLWEGTVDVVEGTTR
jgi:hypothetical protein